MRFCPLSKPIWGSSLVSPSGKIHFRKTHQHLKGIVSLWVNCFLGGNLFLGELRLAQRAGDPDFCNLCSFWKHTVALLIFHMLAYMCKYKERLISNWTTKHHNLKRTCRACSRSILISRVCNCRARVTSQQGFSFYTT